MEGSAGGRRAACRRGRGREGEFGMARIITEASGRAARGSAGERPPNAKLRAIPHDPGAPMFPRDARIEGFDPELAQAIADENRRQEDHVELIASENYASPRVMEAQGSQLTNKYAEGYPGKRYYGGCEYVDVAEQLAIDRVQAAVRRRLRQRAAAFGLAGQPGRVPRAAAAGRHHPGHAPGPRRPPHPRRQGQHQRQAVQRRAVRRRRPRA